MGLFDWFHFNYSFICCIHSITYYLLTDLVIVGKAVDALLRIPSALPKGHLQCQGDSPHMHQRFLLKHSVLSVEGYLRQQGQACDCGMVQGSGDQFHVNFQTMWDRNWWTNPPSVLPCLLRNFEVCLIQFLSMGLGPIAYSKSAHEWHLWLDSAFSSFISSLIIVLPGIISQVTFLSLHSCISQKQVSGPAFGKCNWYSYQTLSKYQSFSTHCNGPRTV